MPDFPESCLLTVSGTVGSNHLERACFGDVKVPHGLPRTSMELE